MAGSRRASPCPRDERRLRLVPPCGSRHRSRPPPRPALPTGSGPRRRRAIRLPARTAGGGASPWPRVSKPPDQSFGRPQPAADRIPLTPRLRGERIAPRRAPSHFCARPAGAAGGGSRGCVSIRHAAAPAPSPPRELPRPAPAPPESGPASARASGSGPCAATSSPRDGSRRLCSRASRAGRVATPGSADVSPQERSAAALLEPACDLGSTIAPIVSIA